MSKIDSRAGRYGLFVRWRQKNARDALMTDGDDKRVNGPCYGAKDLINGNGAFPSSTFLSTDSEVHWLCHSKQGFFCEMPTRNQQRTQLGADTEFPFPTVNS
jgi:hypothetical protein